MSMHSRPFYTPWGALFFAMLGLAWCGYIAFPSTSVVPCISSGCALFKDARIGGISLWWVGGAYFFMLSIICLRGRVKLAWHLARLGLGGDALLLLIMFFTAPCRDCLVVALFLGLTYAALQSFVARPSQVGWFGGEQPPRSLLLPLWFGLFLGNVILTANETSPLYTVGGSENTAVRIYFSPSCPACRDALVAYGNNSQLLPVVEREGDVEAIRRLEFLLAEKVPLAQALARTLEGKDPLPPLSVLDSIVLQIQLLRNKALVLKQGYSALPLIQINGMPRRPTAQSSTPSPASPAISPAGEGASGSGTSIGGQTPRGTRPAPRNPQDGKNGDLPWEVNDLGRCEQNSTEPCPGN